MAPPTTGVSTRSSTALGVTPRNKDVKRRVILQSPPLPTSKKAAKNHVANLAKTIVAGFGLTPRPGAQDPDPEPSSDSSAGSGDDDDQAGGDAGNAHGDDSSDEDEDGAHGDGDGSDGSSSSDEADTDDVRRSGMVLEEAAAAQVGPDVDVSGRGTYDGLAEAVQRLPPGGKPTLKQISVERFSGRIAPGDFDSKVRAWWLEFDSQMLGAQLRDGHRWSELIKCSFLQASLTSDAAKWFNRIWRAAPTLTLLAAGARLIRQYSTKIDEDEIRERIKAATKQHTESYEMYSQRLQNMADSLPVGNRDTYERQNGTLGVRQDRLPSENEQLQYWIVTQSGKHGPVTLLNKLVALLGRLDKTDGVSTDVKPAPKRAKHSHGQPAKAIAAAATVVDRKRKHHHDKDARASKYGPYGAPSWVNENTLCFKCKGRGHMGRDPACPKFATPLGNAAMKATAEDSA
ncbi:hypothetical protein PF005_g196 [Phytophthora fragariae]|uniref:Retrotransposon gag domain-containing protein n=1 Tax=Phytophthora fragariae TaxID=53985 RepID=A0A6A3ZRV0_9STRA|nr:hypothetical protein PF009_g196 [Phytophthora fragariae]KAE9030447.1 hypothetical protein PF011_g618 [Phytophthora fragariae]KAE9141532.1 hypothetical protein PF007_g197 [Phytophthora fragariae]KAE9238582.1 hypothetical protein PF005_g196 [Phytophthora fragariae]KAE9361567.1 hypothetical protein PF008_g923 [Phytophthora fragariae]